MIHAAENTQVELVDIESQAVVGSGTVPSGETSVTITTSAALEIGRHYAARKTGTATPNEWNFRCMRRYGTPEAFSDGTTMLPIPHPADGTSIGHPNSWVVQAFKDYPGTSDANLVGSVAFAMRDPITGDPVLQVGGNHILTPTVFLPLEGTLWASNGQGLAHATLPIPDDVNLIGQVMLFQFWMVDGANTRLSEVVGIRIDGPPAMAAQQGGGGGATGRKRKAARSWRSRLLADKKAVYNPAIVEALIRKRKAKE